MRESSSALRTACAALILTLVSSTAKAETVVLEPQQDTSLYSESGLVSNGAGEGLFVGRTSFTDSVRRALVQFDVAGAVPAGATVTQVNLTLNVNRTRDSVAREIAAHRISGEWGEAGSDAADALLTQLDEWKRSVTTPDRETFQDVLNFHPRVDTFLIDLLQQADNAVLGLTQGQRDRMEDLLPLLSTVEFNRPVGTTARPSA